MSDILKQEAELLATQKNLDDLVNKIALAQNKVLRGNLSKEDFFQNIDGGIIETHRSSKSNINSQGQPIPSLQQLVTTFTHESEASTEDEHTQVSEDVAQLIPVLSEIMNDAMQINQHSNMSP